ncbi:hypothetical protein RHSIM_Rhsim02G0203600 [Rhododendron simsii]|uniref:Heparanase-like protein 3 n=1 Tax=Rhododendron simsii TaxID=118357 RepID=A0A834HB44_RHOSS|nr:hypothetical protein RHSIM_Rhsim02G0203600 [Rhododendron simsii]
MGSHPNHLGLFLWLCYMAISGSKFAASQSNAGGPAVVQGTAYVSGTVSVGTTDVDFICATLDWWPPQKCDYGTCSWSTASLLNLPTIYWGEQSRAESLSSDCVLKAGVGTLPLALGSYKFSPVERDQRARIIFGLNALTGRTVGSDGTATGAWNSTNAESLIKYTINQGYTIDGWEFGVDDHLVGKILDPNYLGGESQTFSSLQTILKNSGTSTVAWVGEAGGAYNSGHNHVTNTFVFSFWYLDQLGMAASFDTKTYCRQSLVGGNYGLLNTTTFAPNPDYYSALLFHRLMGRKVLATTFNGTNKVRAYTHCAQRSKGITLLLINLDGKNTAQVEVSISNVIVTQPLNRNSAPLSAKSDGIIREEYHLTAANGDLQSQTVLLNGKPLTVDSSGGIPPLLPVRVNPSQPVTVGPYSIVFAHFPSIRVPACK